MPTLCMAVALCAGVQAAAPASPQSVSVPSGDGSTVLTAYLYLPQTPAPWPAIVMMHGRSGPYSSAARGRYDGDHLAGRHRMWGEFWAAQGYAALLVDSFGSRGYPAGFKRGTYRQRPPEVNEQLRRPLDAYGALAWLRQRSDIRADRIGLHGWSNGAMAALASLAENPPGFSAPTRGNAFRAALAMYPGCSAQRNTAWRPYAPLLMMVASEDEEVSPRTCQRLADDVHRRGGHLLEFIWYEGAQHAFDDPGKTKQSRSANRAATEDALRRAEAFFRRELRE